MRIMWFPVTATHSPQRSAVLYSICTCHQLLLAMETGCKHKHAITARQDLYHLVTVFHVTQIPDVHMSTEWAQSLFIVCCECNFMCASLFDPFVCETTKACAHQHQQRGTQIYSPPNVSVWDIFYAYRAQDGDDLYFLFLFLEPGHSYTRRNLDIIWNINKHMSACVCVVYRFSWWSCCRC